MKLLKVIGTSQNDSEIWGGGGERGLRYFTFGVK